MYEIAMKKFAPKTARAHYRMGVFCLGIANHVRARQHFERSFELGGKLAPLAEYMLDKLDDLIVREAEAGILFQELLVIEAQDLYEDALKIIAKLEKKYGDTLTAKRLPDVKKRILKKKKEADKIK